MSEAILVQSSPAAMLLFITLSKTKVNAAFTDAEWNTLIASKPSWTFVMF